MNRAAAPWQPARVALGPTLALMGVTTITAVALRSDFDSWAYLRPVLVLGLGMHVAAASLRALRMRGVFALPVLVIAGLVAHAAAFYGNTTWNGVPSASTLGMLRDDLTVVLSEFATAVAPLPANGAFARSAALAMLAVALLADTFAFRAEGRSEALVPSGAMFVVATATGVQRSSVPLAAGWIAAAFVVVGLLRAEHRHRDSSWLGTRRRRIPAAVLPLSALAVSASVIGAVLAPALPGADGGPLVSTRNKVAKITQVVSPLVDIGARLRDQSGPELFSAQANGPVDYWRLLALPDFDGTAWVPPEEDLVDLDDADHDDGGVSATEVEQNINILALGGPLVPSLYRPDSVDGDDPELFWAPDSGSLVAPGGLDRGDSVRITARVPTFTADLLRSLGTSGADDRYRALGALPQGVVETAIEVTQAGTNDFDRALLLQQWFRSEFTYDSSVDLPNNATAIARFLSERRGFCQQFAGTFAVMARALGIPTRVAVGFTAGERDDSGTYHVYGRHAHAWPEVWFDGAGWVAFEPTPGRSSPSLDRYLGIDDAPTTSVDPAASTTAPPTSVDGSTATTVAAQVTSTTRAPLVIRDEPSATPIGVIVALLVLGSLLVATIAWVRVLVPTLRTAHRRRIAASPPDRRIADAWSRAVRALELLGASLDPSTTSLEVVDRVDGLEGVDRRALAVLAARVTRATFARDFATDEEAELCTELADRLAHNARHQFTRQQRIAAAFLPRYLRGRGAVAVAPAQPSERSLGNL